MIKVRMARLLLATIVAAAGMLSAACTQEPVNSPYPREDAARNVLHTAFTQRSPKYLDPASSYSTDETPFTYSIYEPLYAYDYLMRPYRLIPKAAQEVVQPRYFDAQGRELPADVAGKDVAISVYDIPIRRGILYQPHPAFAQNAAGESVYWPLSPDEIKGRYALTDFPETGARELTADDYVYAFRRLASPRVVSPIFGVMAEHVIGMREYGEHLKAIDAGGEQGSSKPAWLDLRAHGFDGVEALDSHTLRIRVNGKYPQFRYWLAMTFTAPIPWEADRFYSQPGMAEHGLSFNTWPVGTGPYMMTESLINRRHVLERNPNFRGEAYPCEGEPGDAKAGLLTDCGKLTPFVDRVVFHLEKESVPLMGKFLQGYYDIPEVGRGDYGAAMKVAASDSAEKAALYADRGIQIHTTTEAQVFYLGFNWLDPVVGLGDTPEQQERNRKLRQALSIAFDWEQYIAIFTNDQGTPAHGPIPPGILGHQPLPQGINSYVYELEDGRPKRRSLDEARRLLAEAGYPDGREAATGRPLILHFDSAGGMGSSPTLDWMRRQLAAINIQLEVRATDYNRFQDKMRNGSAQMFMWGWVADYPDAENFLFLLYGPNAKAAGGGENASNYRNEEFDALFEEMRFLDDGPRKSEVLRRMVEIVQYDAPWMFGYYPASGGAYQAWVGNAKPSQMVRNTLQYYRLDPDQRAAGVQAWNQPVWWPLMLVLAALAVGVFVAWRQIRKRDAAVVALEPTSRGSLPTGETRTP